MPLVIPGITSAPGSKTEEWQNKLVGKKLSDEPTNEIVFCKKDLPEVTRVVPHGSATTMDFIEDRLNIFVAENGVVSHVTHG